MLASLMERVYRRRGQAQRAAGERDRGPGDVIHIKAPPEQRPHYGFPVSATSGMRIMLEPTRPLERRTGAGEEMSADGVFVRRLLIVLLAACIGYATWRVAAVLAVAFGAALLALVLRGLAAILSRRTRLPMPGAVAVVVALLLLALGLLGWLFGSQIAMQFRILAAGLPNSLSRLIDDIESGTWWGPYLLDQLRDMSLPNATGEVAARMGTVFTATFRGLAYTTVLLFAGIYFAAQPERYRRALLRLVPPRRRSRIGEVLDLMGETLQRWLIGQAMTMVAVGTLTAIGLWALGIGAPLALGLIAGLFAFIPYVGPIIAAAPGILMAATQGPMPALYAALLYAGVHVVEGNLITPLIQAEVVQLPPVLTIFAMVIFSLLLGPFGALLAAPLTIVLLVAVQTFYIEDALGERRTWPPSRDGARRD
jgi:predicted PurR-regulated permease PerM